MANKYLFWFGPYMLREARGVASHEWRLVNAMSITNDIMTQHGDYMVVVDHHSKIVEHIGSKVSDVQKNLVPYYKAPPKVDPVIVKQVEPVVEVIEKIEPVFTPETYEAAAKEILQGLADEVNKITENVQESIPEVNLKKKGRKPKDTGLNDNALN